MLLTKRPWRVGTADLPGAHNGPFQLPLCTELLVCLPTTSVGADPAGLRRVNVAFGLIATVWTGGGAGNDLDGDDAAVVGGQESAVMHGFSVMLRAYVVVWGEKM